MLHSGPTLGGLVLRCFVAGSIAGGCRQRAYRGRESELAGQGHGASEQEVGEAREARQGSGGLILVGGVPGRITPGTCTGTLRTHISKEQRAEIWGTQFFVPSFSVRWLVGFGRLDELLRSHRQPVPGLSYGLPAGAWPSGASSAATRNMA